MNNTNIVFFRPLAFARAAAAPAVREARPSNVATSNVLAKRRIGARSSLRTQAPAREVPHMIWRTNPVSGRPECRWMTERSAQTDEGVSRDGLAYPAA
jgi:hypothetical protein